MEAPREAIDLLASAELWEGGAVDGAASPAVLFVAGWEDADPFCAAVCTNDIGLAFCRRCPESVVRRVLATGRPARGRCAAGVGLLAFPAPRGSRRQVAVLRLARPTPRQASVIARRVRVGGPTLRNAVRLAGDAHPRAVLAAARALRDPARLTAWRVRTREMAAVRRRSTAAALAQMIVTGDEYEELYHAAQRQVRELDRSRRRFDALARDALEQLEQTRVGIAHRLHDTAAQSLVAAHRHLEAARARARPDAPLDEQLQLASEHLATAIAEARAVLRGLMPPGLEELGLGPALEMRIRVLRDERAGDDHGAPPPEITVSGRLPRLVPTTERTLYGAASEAVTNALRHARAARIDVSLAVRGSRAVVEVRDDGCGFNPLAASRAADDGHLGLLGLVRQAHWLGGTATIRSATGAGTRVRISVPLDRHVAGERPTQSEEG